MLNGWFSSLRKENSKKREVNMKAKLCLKNLFIVSTLILIAFAASSCTLNADPPVYYTITAADGISNGTVTADKTTAKKDETVTLTLTAADGYGIGTISVKDASNNDIATTTVTAGETYTFVMPESNVTVSATFVPTFTGTAYTALPAGTDGTAGPEGNYVLFGDWPQTVKASSVTVDESQSVTMGANTYYKGSDGAWYAKCTEKAYAYGRGYKYSDGTDVAKASANSTKYFKVEPIKWRVLTDNYSGKKLLLAESILIDCAYYDYYSVNRSIGGNTAYPNNYKESRVRAYLNGLSYTKKESGSADQVTDSTFAGKGFLQTAFTASAQNQIATTAVDNSADSTTDSGNNLSKATSYACDNTRDKIFLLSEQEVTNSDYGFDAYYASGTGNSRIRMTTDWSKASGAYQDTTTGSCYWWLRSPIDFDSNGVHYVFSDGNTANGYGVLINGVGVVPALTLN